MKAVLVIEHRFKKNAKGVVFSSSNSVNTILWERYLSIFDCLTVVARVEYTENVKMRLNVTHPKVNFEELPYYIGPKGFLMNYLRIRRKLYAMVQPRTAYICRLPSINGNILINALQKKNIPFIVELVGDPWDVFAPDTTGIGLNLIHRYRSYRALKKSIARALGVIYVTEKKLQSRYPSSEKAITCAASNVVLRETDIANQPKVYLRESLLRTIRVLSIGSLDQLYKSPDVNIKAIYLLKGMGVRVELHWLGDGKYLSEMKALASKLQIDDRVHFHGNVSKAEVMEELDACDIYVHISRTEGLPRAVIEAMSRGVACIGSDVGGIPELLHPLAIVSEIHEEVLVNKINEFVNNVKKMNFLAEWNLNKSQSFEYSQLQLKRREVYMALKKRLEE